jgi:hypothetical protein
MFGLFSNVSIHNICHVFPTECLLPKLFKFFGCIGVLAVKMLDTPKFEVGGGPVFRFKPWGGPMVGFILMVETEIPLGLSGEKPGEEQLPLILKGGFQVSL